MYQINKMDAATKLHGNSDVLRRSCVRQSNVGSKTIQRERRSIKLNRSSSTSILHVGHVLV